MPIPPIPPDPSHTPSPVQVAAPAHARPAALVTGAARRIGRVIALDLARHGWDVVLHCRGGAAALADAELAAGDARALGGAACRAQVLAADLADEAACMALVPAAVAAMGRLDAVVNNASRFDYDSAATFSTAAADAHWRINTAAPVLLARALHAHLLARQAATGSAPGQWARTGCVINLLDQKLANPNPDYFSYTLSKAALAEATVMLAMALAPQVRVCAVSPGVTLVSGTMNPTEFNAAHQLTPLGRSSTPDDIARAVRFLLESPAITGHTLLVDGGQHLLGQPRDVLFLAQQQLAATPALTPLKSN